MPRTAFKKPVLSPEGPVCGGTVTGNTGPVTGHSSSGGNAARYLDPRTSRWISADPAMGEFVPQSGKENKSLPNGGVYNTINFHVYNYSNNNPVKYVDPDGKWPGWVDLKRRESGWSHDAPQRAFGYTDFFDSKMDLLFDIQGTKFETGDFTLRLWKGDYGMHRDKLPGDWAGRVGGAGGEIGFYNSDGTSMSRSDLTRMGLESTKLEVFRKGSGEYVASREEKSRSFWTTSFSWDNQGNGEDLYSVNTFNFKNEKSATAFADRLRGSREGAGSYPYNGNESISIKQEGKKVVVTWGEN